MPGTEKLPPSTDSSAVSAPTAKKESATAARRSPSRMIRENVHTNVLGRDAGDSTREIDFASDNNSNNNNNGDNRNGETSVAMTNDTKKGWWGSGVFGGDNETSKKNDAAGNMNRKRRKNSVRYDGLQQSSALEDGTLYDPPPLSSTEGGSSSSMATDSIATATVETNATKEDRVREDCSNFFRGMEDDPSSPYHRTRSHRGTGRTTAAANSLLRRMSVRARLSGEVDGALFMSRYERLNQFIDPSRRRSKSRHQRGQQYTGNDNSSGNQDNEDNHDLFLDENDGQDQPSSYREHIPSPTNNVVMGATSLANPHGVRSSMFFEQNGKMLMRLPRDQVRLVMDYNLEPGILSVEQWRNREDAEAASEKLATQSARTRLSMKRERGRERRHRQREKERRRRRKRKKQREQQKEKKQQKSDCDNNPKVDQTTLVQNALVTEEDGQQPLEAVPLEEEKDFQRDIEDPNEEDDSDDNDSYSSYSDDDDSYYDDDLDEVLLPELKYVITIPDDMYRRMVGEISAKLFPPYWGFFKCCHQESERASIKLAIVILTVVMFLLFIGSLEWRTT